MTRTLTELMIEKAGGKEAYEKMMKEWEEREKRDALIRKGRPTWNGLLVERYKGLKFWDPEDDECLGYKVKDLTNELLAIVEREGKCCASLGYYADMFIADAMDEYPGQDPEKVYIDLMDQYVCEDTMEDDRLPDVEQYLKELNEWRRTYQELEQDYEQDYDWESGIAALYDRKNAHTMRYKVEADQYGDSVLAYKKMVSGAGDICVDYADIVQISKDRVGQYVAIKAQTPGEALDAVKDLNAAGIICSIVGNTELKVAMDVVEALGSQRAEIILHYMEDKMAAAITINLWMFN